MRVVSPRARAHKEQDNAFGNSPCVAHLRHYHKRTKCMHINNLTTRGARGVVRLPAFGIDTLRHDLSAALRTYAGTLRTYAGNISLKMRFKKRRNTITIYYTTCT